MRKASYLLFFVILVAFPGSTPAAIAQPARKLVNATDGQDQRFASAFENIEKWIDQKAFPGSVIAVGQHGRLVALKAFGKMDYSDSAVGMSRDTIFDLASVTKVVACTTAAAILYDRKQLDLDAPAINYVPEFGGTPGHEEVLVRHLLSHSSGLHSTRSLWLESTGRSDILKQLFELPLLSKPGEVAQYRDYNMMLLGEIVSRIAGQPLDQFLARNAFGPLGMKHTTYNPPAKWLRRIPPTEEDDRLRHRLVRGVVHDENAFLMGGVSGHAGLFSNARDLSIFAQTYLNGGCYKNRRIFSRETTQLFMTRQPSPLGTTRALGWDTPAENFFPGNLAPPTAVLQIGFTGTSVYIDPYRDAFIVLLTNRVNPTRRNRLFDQAMPAIHGAVLATLDRESR